MALWTLRLTDENIPMASAGVAVSNPGIVQGAKTQYIKNLASVRGVNRQSDGRLGCYRCKDPGVRFG
jgi:hypothetical protein